MDKVPQWSTGLNLVRMCKQEAADPRFFWPVYLQMLETIGLDQIGGMTNKGSAVGLVFMSWS